MSDDPPAPTGFEHTAEEEAAFERYLREQGIPESEWPYWRGLRDRHQGGPDGAGSRFVYLAPPRSPE